MKRISIIFGTRPEAVKLCPLILAMRDHAGLEPHVCITGQHREMLDQVLEVFGVTPDVDLNLMQRDQTLADLTARAISAVDRYLDQYRPHMVLVQGDTSTVLAASLAAFYRQIKIAHVEAGLRTGNRRSPFPEEINRVLTSRLADYHFAPTEQARNNLLAEGVADDRITVTGNTVVDALQIAARKIRANPPEIPGVSKELCRGGKHSRPLVLITVHRRENFGRGLQSICKAINLLADRFPATAFLYPVHLNPKVRQPVFEALGGRENISLIAPLSYLAFVALMDRSTLILTDSGGVQEEASSLGKPVLVMREATDRPEAVEAGTAGLVGTDVKTIVRRVSTLLSDANAYRAMARTVFTKSPYGDGQACARILAAIEQTGLSESRAGGAPLRIVYGDRHRNGRGHDRGENQRMGQEGSDAALATDVAGAGHEQDALLGRWGSGPLVPYAVRGAAPGGLQLVDPAADPGESKIAASVRFTAAELLAVAVQQHIDPTDGGVLGSDDLPG